MAYNQKSLLTDRDRKPVSQYYNPQTDQYEVSTGYNGAVAFHEQGTVMVDMWSGASSVNKTFNKPCQTFAITNDGSSDIDVTIDHFQFTVKVDESFEGKFPVFNSLSISTTSAYRAYVKE